MRDKCVVVLENDCPIYVSAPRTSLEANDLIYTLEKEFKNPNSVIKTTSLGEAELLKEAMRNSEERLVGINIEKPVMKVCRADLPVADDGQYKRECPACKKGILPVRRDENGKLLNTDSCLLCGQRVEYTDL